MGTSMESHSPFILCSLVIFFKMTSYLQEFMPQFLPLTKHLNVLLVNSAYS